MRNPGLLLLLYAPAVFAQEATPVKDIGWDCKLTLSEAEFCQPFTKLLPTDGQVAQVKNACLAHYRDALASVRKVCTLAKELPTKISSNTRELEARLRAKGMEGAQLQQQMAWRTFELKRQEARNLYTAIEQERAKAEASTKSYSAVLDRLAVLGGQRLQAEALGKCGVPDANNSFRVLGAFVPLKGQLLKFDRLLKGFIEANKKSVLLTYGSLVQKAEAAKERVDGLKEAATQRESHPAEDFDFDKAAKEALKSGAKHALAEAAVKTALTEVRVIEEALVKKLGHSAHQVPHAAGVSLGTGFVALDAYLRHSKEGGWDAVDYGVLGAKVIGVVLLAAGALGTGWVAVIGVGAYETVVMLSEVSVRNILSLVPNTRMRLFYTWLQSAPLHQQERSSRGAAADYSCDYLAGLRAPPGSIRHIMPARPMFLPGGQLFADREERMFSECCKLKLAP